MSDNRVSSPKAAKTDARPLTLASRLVRWFDMALNIHHLLGPAMLIHAECFGTVRRLWLTEASQAV